MIITDEMKKKWRDDFINIVNSPDTRKRGEELHKKLSYISSEDLFRPFTI